MDNPQIHGQVETLDTIYCQISGLQTIHGSISKMGIIGGKIPVDIYEMYDGTYEVEPDAFQDQVLDTKNKILRKDLEIHHVPFYATHNPQGGNTAYIAMEVD